MTRPRKDPSIPRINVAPDTICRGLPLWVGRRPPYESLIAPVTQDQESAPWASTLQVRDFARRTDIEAFQIGWDAIFTGYNNQVSPCAGAETKREQELRLARTETLRVPNTVLVSKSTQSRRERDRRSNAAYRAGARTLTTAADGSVPPAGKTRAARRARAAPCVMHIAPVPSETEDAVNGRPASMCTWEGSTVLGDESRPLSRLTVWSGIESNVVPSEVDENQDREYPPWPQHLDPDKEHAARAFSHTSLEVTTNPATQESAVTPSDLERTMSSSSVPATEESSQCSSESHGESESYFTDQSEYSATSPRTRERRGAVVAR